MYVCEWLVVYKVFKIVDIIDELFWLLIGKFYKWFLCDRYWGKDGFKIV